MCAYVLPVLFGRAREQAQELDAEFEKTGRLRGLLHGVPVCLFYFNEFPDEVTD